MTDEKVKRHYHIPDEDDKPLPVFLSFGDGEMILNALSLYSLWLRSKDSVEVPLRGLSMEQQTIFDKLKTMKVDPETIAVELRAGALSHVNDLKDRFVTELTK